MRVFFPVKWVDKGLSCMQFQRIQDGEEPASLDFDS